MNVLISFCQRVVKIIDMCYTHWRAFPAYMIY